MMSPHFLPRALGVALSACTSLVACGALPTEPAPTSTWNKPADGVKGVSSGSTAERFFPLVDGNDYHYDTVVLDDRASSSGGVLMARVHRSSPTSGELRLPARTQHIEYTGEGVVTLGASGERAFILKTPIAIGISWIGEHGGVTRYTAVQAAVTVPSGSYTGCVTTEELRGGDAPMRITTTYCPDVGIVSLEAQGGARVERATLRQYGPPFDIGPDGVTRSTSPETPAP